MSSTISTVASTNPSSVRIPGYVAGRWQIDPSHSDVSFTVRHLMVSKVRGSFRSFDGTIVTAADPLDSTVEVEIDASSFDTRDDQRNAHVKSADFLDTDQFPTITFRSRSVRPAGAAFVLEGDLTIHGVTRPIELDLELNGFTPDPYGGTRVGFSAQVEINRRDYGVDLAMPLDGGGVVVGEKVQVQLEIQAVLADDSAAG